MKRFMDVIKNRKIQWFIREGIIQSLPSVYNGDGNLKFCARVNAVCDVFARVCGQRFFGIPKIGKAAVRGVEGLDAHIAALNASRESLQIQVW